MKNVVIHIAHCCLVLGFFSFANAAETITLEPSNWWTNMSMSEITILASGDGISSSDVKINYQGIEIVKIEKTESTNYLLITIKISSNTLPGKFNIDFIPFKGKAISADFNIYPKIEFQPIKLTNEHVIYRILTDRFSNGNTENDNIKGYYEKTDLLNPSGIHGGDFNGIESNLNYITNLGFTAIELSPLTESNQFIYSYDKYAITNFYQMDKNLGNIQQYNHLIAKAKKLNTPIIQSVILTQIGKQHPWMRIAPFKSWIYPNQSKYGMLPMSPVYSDPYASPADKRINFEQWPEIDIASLNVSEPLLQKYLIQQCIWWIVTTGVDGIKLENSHMADPQFIKQLATLIKNEFGRNFNFITSFQTDSPSLEAGALLKTNSYYFYDYPLQKSIENAFKPSRNANAAATLLYQTVAMDFVYNNSYQPIVFADGLFQNRAFSLVGENSDRLGMLITFMLTCRGIPSFFYATELLNKGNINEGTGVVRSDFKGLNTGDIPNAFTNSGLSLDQQHVTQLIQQLLKWRKGNADLNDVQHIHYQPVNGIYVYAYGNDKKQILVLLNFNDTEKIKFDADYYSDIIPTYSKAIEIITNHDIPNLNTLMLFPLSATVIEFTVR